MNVNLGPGQAAFLDLPGNTLISTMGQRAEVRPVVTPSSASDAPNSCTASAEVYINGLGTTSSYYPPGPAIRRAPFAQLFSVIWGEELSVGLSIESTTPHSG